jgi:hypothetical protein
METISFTKLPVCISDSIDEYHLFDILLPERCDEQSVLMIISLLTKFRNAMYNQKNLNNTLSEFFDSQSYRMFNLILVSEMDSIYTNSQEGFKKIKFNNRVYSLNNQEQSDLYFSTTVCMNIMSVYKLQ